MRHLHLLSLLALTSLVAAAAPACSGDGGPGGGGGTSTSTSSGESTTESTGMTVEKCSFSDPPAGSTTVRVSVIGVAALKGKKAAFRLREQGTGKSVVTASEQLGGGPYCPGFTAADPAKSYDVDVVLDLDGDGMCGDPPKDAVLTGAVPAFVNGIAEIDFVYDGTSSGTCGDFMLP